MPMSDLTFVVKGGVEMTVPAAVINEGYNDEVFQYILSEGLKAIAAKGMTGIKATDKEAIAAKARENLQALEEGKIPTGRATRASKAKGLPKPVAALAMKLARAQVDILLIRAGRKPANCDNREKTRLSKEYLEHPDYGPAIIAKAQAQVAEFEAQADLASAAIHLDSVQENPTKTKMNKERAARSKENKATKAAATPMRRGVVEHRPSA